MERTGEEKLIKVLWVEDDDGIVDSIKEQASKIYHLDLNRVDNWEEAEKQLENDYVYDRWSAIILDAKCRRSKTDGDDAKLFLSMALEKITNLSEKYGRIVPWYILTAGSDDVKDDIPNVLKIDKFKEQQKIWDSDWMESENKSYYSKNTDKEKLFERIKRHHSTSRRTQIRFIYNDIFNAMFEVGANGVDDESLKALEDLLLHVHFYGNKQMADARKKLRLVYEGIFRSMMSRKILPSMDKINATWCLKILKGENIKTDVLIVEVDENKRPIFFGDGEFKCHLNTLYNCYKICGKGLHSRSYSKSRNMPMQISQICINGYTLQLCGMIIWYCAKIKNYLQSDNFKYWSIIDEERFDKAVKEKE